MSLGDFPIQSSDIPQRTLYGTLLPPFGKVVAYVRATPLNDPDQAIETMRVTTLSAALNRVVAGRGDIIVVLPGHTENVTVGTYLSTLAAGTKVIGVGQGASRPTFTFTATASRWNVAAANVLFSNLILNFAGGAAVTIGIDVTGASVTFSDCEFVTSALNTSRADNVIRLSAGADDFLMYRNRMRGANAANGVVDNILVNATVARTRIIENQMSLGVTVATVGLIRFAAIATDGLIADNYFSSNLATSACILDFDAAATGLAYNNRAAVMADQAASAGFVVGTTGYRFCENYLASVTGASPASGFLSPAVDT
jgi:hypothetical protein